MPPGERDLLDILVLRDTQDPCVCTWGSYSRKWEAPEILGQQSQSHHLPPAS